MRTGGGGGIHCGRGGRRRSRSCGRNSGRWNWSCCGISSGSINCKGRWRAQGDDGNERRGADPVVAIRQLTGNISDIQLRNSDVEWVQLSYAIVAVVILESVVRHGNCNGIIERIEALTNPRNVLEKATDTGEIARQRNGTVVQRHACHVVVVEINVIHVYGEISVRVTL